MAQYTLPELPYDYAALEPFISGQIMELHHSKHHAAYVAGANTALDQMAEAREKDAFGTINLLEKNLAFHLGGHINHSVSGRTWRRAAATSRTVNSALRSTSSSARGTASASSSVRTPTRSRVPAGPSWPGTPLVSG